MNRRIAFVPFLILAAAAAWAQMGVPPGPELKKLDYFVGSWTTEGTVAPGPWGMGGKFSASGSWEWMQGNFFLQGHADFQMPPEVGGNGKDVMFMGYDTDQNTYTHDSFNSMGRHQASKGTLSGDTWTWTSSANYAGQDIQQNMTMKVLSPTSYTVKFEISLDGKNWMTFMDGKATKK